MKSAQQLYSPTPLPNGYVNGSIGPTEVTTNRNGRAIAYYTAGKKIGMVNIKIDDVRANVWTYVQVELRSDAPAKIDIDANPASLPADGRSRANIDVKVTDINDNPNNEVTVQFSIKSGCGRMSPSQAVTDFNGKAQAQYIAGTTVGVTRVRAKVSSRVPNENERLKAKGTVFIPRLYDEMCKGDEVTVIEWFKDENDDVEKGEALVAVRAENGTEYKIKAPVTGRLERIRLIEDETAEFGQTIGLILSDHWEY